MGESSVVDDPSCPTAYTDGKNKKYGKDFLEKLSIEEVSALALHENLHVMLKHIPRHKDLMMEDARLANVAMDYVVNDIIVNIKDKNLCKLPKGGLYDPKYHDWSVREVYDDLKKMGKGGKGGSGGAGNPNGSGDTGDLQPLDMHDYDSVNEATPEELKKLSDQINEAIQQGGMLAGKFGVQVPRVIKELVEPQVDWRDALRDFVTTETRGNEQYTWRRLNKRRLASDLYMPSSMSERMGEIIIAIDTSGSIGEAMLQEFGTELANICDTVNPNRVRVLWWDTQVHGEQVFEDNYNGLAQMLKPLGGGGTKVSCVSEYLTNQAINADCVVVFTDGFVENDISWRVNVPTLWMVTHKRDFVPPAGQMVKF